MILRNLTVRARVVLTALALGSTILTSSCGLVGAVVSSAIVLAPLKLLFACLPEGTEIDLPGGETRAIEDLRSGDVVIGYRGEPVKILQIHGYLEDPEETEFFEITFSTEATVDLCGMHRIEDIRAQDLEVGTVLPSGKSVVAIRTYRGVERSYDILTEDKGYQIGGVAVNSMIEEMYQAGRQNKISRE